MGAFVNLIDWGFRRSQTQFLIPKLCPNAISKSHTLQTLCDKRVQLLHRGRTCHDWTLKLSDSPVSLEDCRNKAFAKGYEGFIWTDVSDQENAEESNCMTHPEDGKKAQSNDAGLPLESTCNYVPDYDEDGTKDKPDSWKGWLNQDLAAGNGETTSHYAVLKSASDCPSPWSRRQQSKYFQYKEDYPKYFIK